MLTVKTIMDYFDDEVDYPSDVALNPLPMNTLYCYISSTFLDGFINYVTPLKVFVLDRYEDDKTEEIKTIKYEVHRKLSCLGDDIIILAKIESEDEPAINRFMFFWFDMDVSDCQIGRFETTDKPFQVFEALNNWLELEKEKNSGKRFQEMYDNGILNYHELPLSFLNGWLSF